MVCVTHDSEPELAKLLGSLDRHLEAGVVDLIVVDSGSRDGSVALARAWPRGARVVELGTNRGFGAGCNAGLELASREVTVLLNPDTELIDDSLARLATEAARPPRRILAPLVLNPDRSRQDTAHPLPGRTAALLGALVPAAALPGPLGRAVAPWRADRPRRVGWAVGCCVAAPTALLRELGPFDEEVQLYYEDLELCAHAATAGVETWFWPAARVVHSGGHASRTAFGGEAYELQARRRREAVQAALGRRARRTDDLAQWLTFRTRITTKRLAGRPTGPERARLDALRAARRA